MSSDESETDKIRHILLDKMGVAVQKSEATLSNDKCDTHLSNDKCDYCKKLFLSNDTKCSYCGAPRTHLESLVIKQMITKPTGDYSTGDYDDDNDEAYSHLSTADSFMDSIHLIIIPLFVLVSFAILMAVIPTFSVTMSNAFKFISTAITTAITGSGSASFQQNEMIVTIFVLSIAFIGFWGMKHIIEKFTG